MDRPHRLRHEDDVPWTDETREGAIAFRRRQLGAATGREKLGCSLYELQPGRRLWTYHWHAANEEALYVLEGSGTLRLPEGEFPIRKGDYATLPAGPRGAHLVANTSGTTMRLLFFSTMIEPEVAVYPDSNKLGIFAGSAPGGEHEKRTVFGFWPAEAKVGFWDREP